MQGTDSGPRAHLGRGSEPIGGANSSTPSSITLNFFACSYLSSSLAAQGAEFFLLKNVLLIVAAWEALPEGLGMTTTYL
jgi:hypothetical protein